MANSFAAGDAVINEVFGSGVVSGLLLTNPTGAEVQCSTGVAIAGHVVALTAVADLTLAAGTWDIYLCQPVFTYSGTSPVAGSFPGTNGVDAGVLTSVVTGTLPAAMGAMLATVVSTGTAISSINNAPSGRNTLPGPAPAGTRTLYAAQANFTTQPSGSSGASFTLTETPNPTNSLIVYKNGLLIDPTKYTLAAAVVTFATAPASTDTISAAMHY